MKMNPSLYDVAREEDEAEQEDINNSDTLLAFDLTPEVRFILTQYMSRHLTNL